MLHLVYKTTNTETGQYYIGVHSTNDLNDGYLGSGDRLRRAVNKYGKESFERHTLRFFDNRESALAYERELVTPELVSDPNCYNLAIGNGHIKPGNIGRKQGSKNSGYSPKRGWSKKFILENAHRLDDIYDSLKSPYKKMDLIIRVARLYCGLPLEDKRIYNTAKCQSQRVI